MKIEFKDGHCIATREPGDPKYYGTRNGAGESRLLAAIRDKLNAEVNDLIKKRMAKDGHLVDDLQQYIRTRKKSSQGLQVMIYSSFWALRGANDDWNERGDVWLSVVRDPFVKETP